MDIGADIPKQDIKTRQGASMEVPMWMDLLRPRLIFGLVIPALKPPLSQSTPAESSGALAMKHVLVYLLEIPALMSFGDESLQQCLDFLILARGKITKLFRVGAEIIELWRICGTDDKLPRAAAHHHDWGYGAFPCVLAENSLGVAPGSVEEREKRLAVHG